MIALCAASYPGSLGESVGRGAWAKSTLGPLLGTVRRDWSSCHARAFPIGRMATRFGPLTPVEGTTRVWFDLARGERRGSSARVERVTFRVRMAATAARKLSFCIIQCLLVVAALPARFCFLLLNTTQLMISLRIFFLLSLNSQTKKLPSIRKIIHGLHTTS